MFIMRNNKLQTMLLQCIYVSGISKKSKKYDFDCRSLPPLFPQDPPSISVHPPIYHQWVDSQSKITNCPSLSSVSIRNFHVWNSFSLAHVYSCFVFCIFVVFNAFQSCCDSTIHHWRIQVTPSTTAITQLVRFY